MIGTRRVLQAALVLGLLVVVSGCFLKREEGRNRAVLKADWQVPDDMATWIALANTEPKEVTNAELKLTYYVLCTHNIVPPKLNGHLALSANVFEQISKIKVPAPKTPEGELWQMRVGRRVPKEKDGWVALPLSYPVIEKRGEAGIAVLGADLLIPKEMDGWVALDRDALGSLEAARQMGLANELKAPPIKDAGAMKTREVNPDVVPKESDRPKK
jgi:hypothetical protein